MLRYVCAIALRLLSRLIRAVSLLPVLAVTGIVCLEYVVFVGIHLLPAMKGAKGPLPSLAFLLEALLFHFFVGCMGVSYYKVVMTGSFTTFPSYKLYCWMTPC